MPAKKMLLIGGVAGSLLAALLAWKFAHRPSRVTGAPSAASASASAGPRELVPLSIAETIYDGKLAPGWQDWGWGPHDLNRGGPAKVVFGGFGGVIFHHSALEANFGAVSFRYKAPESWPLFLNVSLKSSRGGGNRLPSVALQPRHIASLPDGFREVLISFSELNPDRLAFESVAIAASTMVGSDWVSIDKVVLVQAASEGVQGPLRRRARLSVLCRAPTHPINPAIYGSSGGDWESGQTAQRWGGNPTTRFNWELGAWNLAKDWFFENTKAADLQQFLNAGLEHDVTTALTVPIIGWVAKDATSVGFPRARFADQRKYDPYRSEAGDGHRADGTPIQQGSPEQTSVQAPPAFIGRWIRTLRERDRAHSKRSVQTYILDNEPSLWDDTHADVHPTPAGYDEILDRTLRYAAEIRKADPEGLIAGPAEWGWMGYMYSGRDRVAGKAVRPDRRAHGDVPFIPWYLMQIAAHEKRSGERLLDTLDVHFYPAAEGIYGGSARTDADASALRLRSTRALWDPSYSDESWIGEPIQLIPRLREWIKAYHPGLSISIGEWSFGADEHVSGGLATAEVLGRFGQQGLDSAFYWGGPKKGTATFWAFRAFRNFDGAGGRFQDLSLATKDGDDVSLFASRDPAGSKIVAILLNRDPKATTTAQLELDRCGRPVSRRVFRFTGGEAGLVLQPSAPEQGGQPVSEALPPYSLTVLELSFDSAP